MQDTVGTSGHSIPNPPPSSPDHALASPKARQSAAMKEPTTKQIAYPFWFGGSASSMAACVTHPLDLVKVRLQMHTPNLPTTTAGTLLHILRTASPLGLYQGLSASILRQITYSTTRFGLYETLKTRYARRHAGVTPSAPLLACMAALTGAAGGLAGNAADVVNVRMQQDAALPVARRRGYAHGIDGLIRLCREEGLGRTGCMRGVGPNSVRAATMTAGQLASYDVFKGWLLRWTPLGDTLMTHFVASCLAGAAAATVTNPIDVVKTRVMSASGDGRGLVALVAEMTRADGVRWMFRGWTPSFLRLGPQTICTFLALETHRKVYRQTKGLD